MGERYILQFDTAILYHLKEMGTLLHMIPSVIFMRKKDKGSLHGSVKEKLDKIIKEYQGTSGFKEASTYAALIEIYVELGRNKVWLDGCSRQIHGVKQQEYFEAVMSACTYINHHITENLTLGEVARIGGFSKYHFTRIFKQYMNMTFYEYLSFRRIKRAEEFFVLW